MEPSLTNMQELKTFVIDEGHGVKGLSDLNIKTLPDLFIQPPEKRLDMSKVVSHELIPIIDMSNSEDPEVMESICDAAEKHGFFQIVNHGIPLSLMEDVKDAGHKFFRLPVEEKRKYLFTDGTNMRHAMCLIKYFNGLAKRHTLRSDYGTHLSIVNDFISFFIIASEQSNRNRYKKP